MSVLSPFQYTWMCAVSGIIIFLNSLFLMLCILISSEFKNYQIVSGSLGFVGDLTLKRLGTTALVVSRQSDRLVESYFGQRGSRCSCLFKKGKVRLWKSSFAGSHV